MKVYLARDPRSGLIKIGTTTYPVWVRLQALASAVKGPLELLASAPGSRRVEAGLHRLFWHFHEGHEWFRPDPTLLAAAVAIREGWFDFGNLPEGPSPLCQEASLRSWARRRERPAA